MVTILVSNEPPVFEEGPGPDDLAHIVGAGTLVGTVAAVDPDSGTVTYSLADPSLPFAVEPGGSLVVAGTLRPELSPYEVEIVAADDGDPPLTTSVVVPVMVLYEVQPNDGFRVIAALHYGDPGLDDCVADANPDIVLPIDPGDLLRIPRVEDCG